MTAAWHWGRRSSPIIQNNSIKRIAPSVFRLTELFYLTWLDGRRFSRLYVNLFVLLLDQGMVDHSQEFYTQ
jgi:hypothetical protein